jgi:NAD(P)-dependent dehydrogenase (short-subunit alcohol dehydrogenase family)
MDRPMSRVAVVTGAAKPNGIGAACARGLAADGFRVVVADVRAEGVSSHYEPDEADGAGIKALVEELEAQGAEASSVTGDVSTEDGSVGIIDHAVARFGRVDVLVNNAAAPHGDEHADLDKVPVADWDRVMTINSRGMFLMSRAAFAVMREQRYGRIVSISSIAGRVGITRTGAYGASKAAIIGLTRSMAVDGGPLGITANAVCPGFIDTNRIASSVRRARPGEEDEARADLVRRVPVGRLGKAEDIAAAVRFFASEGASYVTAQVLTVDGGVYPS